MAVQEQLMTIEAFQAFLIEGADPDYLYELDEGEIIKMSKPGLKHGVILMYIGRLIANYVEANQLGYVTAAETGFILGSDERGKPIVRGLDAAFISHGRAPQGLPDGFAPFAPDLAVEVISPHNDAQDSHKKVLQLLRAGTALVWVFYPQTRTAVVHTAEMSKTFTEDDELDGSAVLPGFRLPLKAVFTATGTN